MLYDKKTTFNMVHDLFFQPPPHPPHPSVYSNPPPPPPPDYLNLEFFQIPPPEIGLSGSKTTILKIINLYELLRPH